MYKPAYRLQRLDYRKGLIAKLVFFMVLLTILYTLFSLPYVHAQEISPSVKKSVVKNFKADLKNYLPFGTSENCELKPNGDANCDGSVNQFDLSIWEVEFNSANSPKRSDFNNDGLINLLDFGIWRNTFFPQKTTGLMQYLSSRIQSGIQKLLPGFRVEHTMTVLAQENPINTQPLDSSQAIISGSGNSFVVNSDTNNQTQQVSFDPNGSAISSQLFDTNGRLLANVSFLSSGTTSIITQEDGVSVQINKTAEGAVIEFFRNPDGSLIAIKSWPTQASYGSSQPPTAVTLPGKDPNTFFTLNIQPNGGGILQEIDARGNVLTQSNFLANGYYSKYDLRTETITQSNPQIGFASLTLPNKLGGETNYIFYGNRLTTITQTDSKNNFWQAIAKPDGNWDMISKGGGETKTVADPVAELKSGTISPTELVNVWKYYSENAVTNANTIDFNTSFNSTSRTLADQVRKADQAYALNQVPEPTVLGIVKEVKAQDAPVNQQSTSNINNGVAVQVTDFTGSNGQTNMTVSVFGPGATGAAQNQIGTSTVTVSGTTVPDVSGMTPAQAMSAVNNAAVAGNAQTAPGAQPLDSLPAVPADTPSQPAQPAAPAAPGGAAPAAGGAAPATPAAATPTGPAGPPPGFQEGRLDGGNFTQTWNPETQQIVAFYDNGAFQTTNFDESGQVTGVSFSYSATDPSYPGASVEIDTNGYVTGFSKDDVAYEVNGSTLTTVVNGETVTVTDPDVIGFGNSLIDVQDQVWGGDAQADLEGTCFLPGTLISTPDGPIPIETLKPGTKVYSFNEKTRQKEVSDFSNLDINFVDEYLILNSKIKTTTYHPFYTQTGRGLILKKAEELKIGDLLIDENNNPIAVKSIERITENVTVYNLLNVSPNENFFAEGILVHNYPAEAADVSAGPVNADAPPAEDTQTDANVESGSGSIDI